MCFAVFGVCVFVLIGSGGTHGDDTCVGYIFMFERRKCVTWFGRDIGEMFLQQMLICFDGTRAVGKI